MKPPENRMREGLRNSQFCCGSTIWLETRPISNCLSPPSKPLSRPLFLGEQDSQTILGEVTLVLALVLVSMQNFAKVKN